VLRCRKQLSRSLGAETLEARRLLAITLRVMPDLSTSILNTGPEAVAIDAFYLRSPTSQLSPEDWRSLADWAAVEPNEATATLGKGALSFGEAVANTGSLVELNLAGAGVWQPGTSVAIGRPLLGSQADVPGNVEFFFRRASPEAAQEAGIIELTPDASTPTVAFVAVPPQQTASAIDSVRFTFSEPVQGFDLSDLKWLRDGLAAPLPDTVKLSTVDGQAFELSGLSTAQAAPGKYSLELRSVGSHIVDNEGFPLLEGLNAKWQLLGPLQASISTVPSPRRDAADSVQIIFTEAITGLDLADLSLTRNGGANLLTGHESLTTNDNKVWTLAGLAPATSLEGSYRLTLIASASGIEDALGRTIAVDASTQWTIDQMPPTANIIDVTPDPRGTRPSEVRIVFSEDVAGLSTRNFSLQSSTGQRWNSLQSTSATLRRIDGRTYVLENLPYYTATQTITLTLNASTRVTDLAGNLLLEDASDTWSEDITPPIGWFLQPPDWNQPDPLPWLDIEFSEPISGLSLQDFSVRQDGNGPNLLTGAQTLTQRNATTWRLDHLDAVTLVDGTFQLRINNHGQIVDLLGTPLQDSLYYSWVLDRTAPTVDVIDVQPDPHAGGIDAIQVRFSEPVANFGIEDLELRRDGGVNLLLGSENLFNVDGQTWKIVGLADLTKLPGEYTFSVIADGPNITDFYGHPLVAGASDTWSVVPTVQLGSPPSATNQPVAGLQIDFDTSVEGFDLGDLQLTRDGQSVALTNAQLLTADRQHWRLENLWDLTSASGSYQLKLTAAGSGIVAGNNVPLVADASSNWALDQVRPAVVDIRFVAGLEGGATDRVILDFSEPVLGAPLPGMWLSRDGGPNLLVGPAKVTFNGNSLTFSDLETALATPGNYVFRVDSSATELRDPAGNRLAADAQEAWQRQVTMVLQVAADGSAYLINRSDGELNIDGYLIRSASGSLDPTGWRSIEDWVAEDLAAVTAALGSQAAAFGETSPTPAALAELNLSGGGVWSPGEAIALGKPFTGLSTNIPLQSSFFYHVVGIEASQVGSIELVLPSEGPTVRIEDVSPDPALAPLTELQITFSEEISGFGLEDLRLSRNGTVLPWRAQTLVSQDQMTWTLKGLTQLTAGDGQFELALSRFGSQIVDQAARPLVGDAVETWRTDVSKPTGQWSGVKPKQSAPIDSVRLDFSEPIEGLELADLELIAAGGPNLIGAGQRLATVDGQHWVLSGIASATASEGSFTLRLNADRGVHDLRGNALAQAVELNFDIDRTAPTVDFVDVASNGKLPQRIEIRFSEPVAGLTLNDFRVAINEFPLRPLQGGRLVQVDPVTWALTELSGFPFMFSGDIHLEITPARGVLQDAAGNRLATGAIVSWNLDVTAPSGEFVFPVDWHNPLPMPVVYLSFNEPVRGLEQRDLELSRDGQVLRLTGSQTLVQVSATLWRLDNLEGLTTRDGYYSLQLKGGSNVTDIVGNQLSWMDTMTWRHDSVRPTAKIVPVSPDPRNSSVERIEFLLSPDTYSWSVDPADLTLTRNGVNIPLLGRVGIEVVDASRGRYAVQLLASMTSAPGAYEFVVGGEDSNIVDYAGNRLVTPAVERWLRGFAVQVTEVAPKVRTQPLDTLTIEFSEPVDGFDLADITLARGGGANLLTAAQTLTTSDRRVWTLNNVAAIAAADGEYELVVSSGNIKNAAGSLLVGGARETWTLDSSSPTVTVGAVVPAVRTSLDSLAVTLSEPIVGFGLLNLRLTRNGAFVDLYAGATSRLTTSDGLHWTLRLKGLNLPDGDYELSVINYGLTDAAGHLLTGPVTKWTISTDPSHYNSDFNGDGQVDLTDFDLLKSHFGARNVLHGEGDADGDGDVDLFDFGVLKAQFGTTPPAALERRNEVAADAVFGNWR